MDSPNFLPVFVSHGTCSEKWSMQTEAASTIRKALVPPETNVNLFLTNSPAPQGSSAFPM